MFRNLILVFFTCWCQTANAAIPVGATIGFWPFTDVTMADDVSGYGLKATAKFTYNASRVRLNNDTVGPFNYPSTSYELAQGGYFELVSDQLFNLNSDTYWAMLIKAIPNTPEGPFLQHLPTLNASVTPGFTIWTSKANQQETIRLDTRYDTIEDPCEVSSGWQWLYLSYDSETKKLILSCGQNVLGTGTLTSYTTENRGFAIGCGGQCLDTYISCYMAISKSTLTEEEQTIVQKMCEFSPKSTLNSALEMNSMITNSFYSQQFSLPVGSSISQNINWEELGQVGTTLFSAELPAAGPGVKSGGIWNKNALTKTSFRVECFVYFDVETVGAINMVALTTKSPTSADFNLNIDNFKGLTVMFNAASGKIYVLYSNSSTILNTDNYFYDSRITEFNYTRLQGMQNIIVEVVEESLSLVIDSVGSDNVVTAFIDFPLPGFQVSVPAGNRAFGLTSVSNGAPTFNIYSLNFFELENTPVSTTTSSTTSSTTSTTTSPPPTTTTTEITTTVKLATFTDEESYLLEYLGNIKVDGNLTLTNGSSVPSFPWPVELNISRSDLYLEVTGIFQTLIADSFGQTGDFRDIKVNITSCRQGSFISDYVVALRSLTSLSAAEIQKKVAAKIMEVKQMASLTNALVKEFNVNSAKVLKEPSTTTTSTTKNSADEHAIPKTFVIIFITLGLEYMFY